MAVKWSLSESDLGPEQVGPPGVTDAPAGLGRMLLCLQMMDGSAPDDVSLLWREDLATLDV